MTGVTGTGGIVRDPVCTATEPGSVRGNNVVTTSVLAGWRRLMAIALGLLLVAAACGGGDDGSSADDGGDTGGSAGGEVTDSNDDPEAEVTPGGKVVYGLEAETSAGWCLSEAQLAISGIQVARTLYDTLVAPNEKGEYVGLLAEDVTSNKAATVWDIKLRKGVTFHDGSKLDANVVANNLDAYRGVYADAAAPRPERHGPGNRTSLLFAIVLQNVKAVDVVDDMTVRVTMTDPWPAFPAFLFSSGRMGMMAQKQLDSEQCGVAENFIGTGPFQIKEWRVNSRLVATRFDDYWMKDEEGNQLPYLDEIEYRPITEGAQRVNALRSGEVQAMHTSSALNIDDLRGMAETGEIGLVESDAYAEVGYFLLQSGTDPASGEPRPFDSLNARLAFAHAIDREQVNQVRGKGIPTIADGPFAPGSPGYVEDPGFPEYDLEKAKEYVQKYEDEMGEPLEIVFKTTPDPDVVLTADLIQEMAEEAGIKVSRERIEQAQLINEALGGDFDVLSWRNHPGGDPDTQLVWWRSGYPTNFGRIEDPKVDQLLDEGRSETDPKKREEIYADLNRRMAEQAYNIWMSYTIWAIGTDPGVHGILGPNMPDGSGPFPGLATGHPVSAMWIEQ